MIDKNCLRCNHSWTPYVLSPKKCPHCGSGYWNRDYQRKPRIRPSPPKKPRGRPVAYPQLQELAVGAECLLPWVYRGGDFCDPRPKRAVKYAQRGGNKYMRIPTPHGLLVRRIK